MYGKVKDYKYLVQKKHMLRLPGKLLASVFVIIILAVIVLAFGSLFYYVVPAGHIGVVFDPFAGGVQHWEMDEGFNLKLPWQGITPYSVRTMAYNMHRGGDDISVPALTSEGLTISLDVTILYHIDKAKAWEIHKEIGPYYPDIIIKPVARAIIRDTVARYKAAELYTTEKRLELQNRITDLLVNKLKKKNIIVEGVLVRNIYLPEELMVAIENKLKAEQDAERMVFVLQKEEREAKRKVIEAEGIAKSNAIIANSLTPNYLTWYWIKSLSYQRSVIYVPIGNNGMPLFKDIDTLPNITYTGNSIIPDLNFTYENQ